MAFWRATTDPFEELSGTWWDGTGVLHAVGVLLDPVRVPFIFDVLGSELGSGPHRVLDLGAGGGVLSETLYRRGFSVVSVDPSLASIRAGKSHAASTGAGVGFLAGRGEQLPFGDDAFDAVVCMEVLEHVDDPAAVVAQVSRVLRPEGVFIFSGLNRTLINRVGLVFVAQDLLGLIPRGTHEWKRLLRPEEIVHYMQVSALHHVRTEGVGIRFWSLPRAVVGLAGLLIRRLTYPQAARRIQLVRGTGTGRAYQGFGRRPGIKAD